MRDISTTYNAIDAPLVTKYEAFGLGISRAYHDRGMLKWLHSVGVGMTPFMDLRFVYDTLGRIVSEYDSGSTRTNNRIALLPTTPKLVAG